MNIKELGSFLMMKYAGILIQVKASFENFVALLKFSGPLGLSIERNL